MAVVTKPVVSEKRDNWLTNLIPRHRCSAVLAMILALAASSALAQTRPASEYQIKAAFLYEFGRFVEWPASISYSESQFPICVLGVDPFGVLLDEALKSKSVGELTVVPRRILGVNDATKCRVLFISSSEDRRLQEILSALGGDGILTVGEGIRFSRLGGMISFTIEENHVRFAINASAAEEAGLRVSSQLLRLATIVETERGEP